VPMHVPSKPVRRILLPVDVAVLVVLAALFALGTALGVIAVPLTPRRRPLRIAAFGVSYCAMELVVLVAAGALWALHAVRRLLGTRSTRAWIAAHQALLAWALGWVLGAARVCFGFRVTVADPSTPNSLSEIDPVLVLARHGGPGDSFALVHLLITRFHRRVLIVLKDILQLDPVIDVVLNRLGCCFLPRSTGAEDDSAHRVADMAHGLSPHDALLLFPEGANWTPRRRRRAIQHLSRRGLPNEARVAGLMTNVLPPRSGGVLACLDARPGIDIVMVAHAGLDRIVRSREAWKSLPLSSPMTVRMWDAVGIPETDDDRVGWLTKEWAIIDEWIDACHAGALSNRGGGTRAG
jgi:1-acyl-sn-glycerol-3-phosphate acyltransferase